MKLEQGQVWKKENEHYRIVKWARETIVYKAIPALETKVGTMHTVTKKEFCRLIKGAELLEK